MVFTCRTHFCRAFNWFVVAVHCYFCPFDLSFIHYVFFSSSFSLRRKMKTKKGELMAVTWLNLCWLCIFWTPTIYRKFHLYSFIGGEYVMSVYQSHYIVSSQFTDSNGSEIAIVKICERNYGTQIIHIHTQYTQHTHCLADDMIGYDK